MEYRTLCKIRDFLLWKILIVSRYHSNVITSRRVFEVLTVSEEDIDAPTEGFPSFLGTGRHYVKSGSLDPDGLSALPEHLPSNLFE